MNDFIGKKFKKLTVVGFGEMVNGRRRYECICECGNSKLAAKNALEYGSVGSCGCEKKGPKPKHGMRHSRVYRIWIGMKDRCLNRKSKDYAAYEHRGICDEWLVFSKFYLDMGDPPTDSHQIDRINNSLGYQKDNCRWATPTINSRNKNTSKYWFIHGERFESISVVAKRYGVTPTTAHRWFMGSFDSRRGKYTPPKNGYTWEYKYER